MRFPLIRSNGDETPVEWWEILFAPIVVPLLLLFVLAIGLLSLPVTLLYPERKLTNAGFDSEHDQQAANAMVDRMSKTPFYMRILYAGLTILIFPFAVAWSVLRDIAEIPRDIYQAIKKIWRG